MRNLVAFLSTAVVAFAGWVTLDVVQRPGPAQPRWIKLVFGLDGRTADWTGNLTIDGGRVVEMVEWGFEERDSFDATQSAWKIATGLFWPTTQGHQWGGSFAEPQRGVLVKLEAAPTALVKIATHQGNFEFRISELAAGRPTLALNGRASASLLGDQDLLADTKTEDDFPAIAIGPNGHRFVGWIGYDDAAKKDHLLVRDTDDPNAGPQSIAPAGEFASLHLVGTPPGLRALWCSPAAGGDWEVYTATYDNGRWSDAKRLTTAAGSDLHLTVARGRDGALWLAWQSLRNGNSDIYAKVFVNGKWSDDLSVTKGSSNEWEPALSVDDRGRAWVGYDTYEHGNYDVYLTSLTRDGGTIAVGERIAVARSDEFEAHASVLADGARVWVAYDSAGPNWGKDFATDTTIYNGKYAEPLHAARRLGLRCVIDGAVYEPSAPLPVKTGPRRVHYVAHGSVGDQVRFHDFPQLARDGAGRVWLFFRLCRQGYTGHPKKGGCWDIFATTYDEGGWLEPIQLPHSEGRQNQRVACTVGADGRLVAAWSDGNHHVDRKYRVHWGTLPSIAAPAAAIPLQPCTVEPPSKPTPTPRVPWTLDRGSDKYHVYFGDLHRHTSISLCTPTIDGCLTDAHRYALDAAELDFLGITDHTRDTDPFPWWRTQKACDLFHIPGRYVPIYSYERSNSTAGGGHRNVFFLKRGAEVNIADYVRASKPGMSSGDPDVSLYPWLKERGDSLTAAHTPAFQRGRNRGTWTFNDPQVEPVAEIFQAYRRSYERPDTTAAAGRFTVTPEASLWYALAQGYRLGFIASSDHHSTHLSYACVWAKEKTREAIFEALAARRTYAATDRIALDFRIGNAVMGEEIKATGKQPQFTVRAAGTAPIDEVQILRSGAVLETLHPNQRQIQLEYTDPKPMPGRSYYYVRLHQQDGAFAWGSPIWVQR